jgi:DNA-binding MarR family transcriptional regulator
VADQRSVDAVRGLARAARLLEKATGDLSLAHYRILSAVAGGDARASRIAARLALGKPAVSTAVETLCQRGLLEREDHDGDQRVVVLRLTRDGAARLRRVETDMSRWLDALRARTPDGDAVLDALVHLGDAIEQAAATR